MIRYLLDTNVVSELRKTRPHGGVVNWLADLSDEQIFISVVTLAELQTGIELTRRQDPAKAADIQSWLDSIEISFACVSMDAQCFREWARLMVGKPDGLREDAMIAATARVHGYEVATRDSDFRNLGVKTINPFRS